MNKISLKEWVKEDDFFIERLEDKDGTVKLWFSEGSEPWLPTPWGLTLEEYLKERNENDNTEYKLEDFEDDLETISYKDQCYKAEMENLFEEWVSSDATTQDFKEREKAIKEKHGKL